MIRRTATTAAMLATFALAATGCAGEDQPEAEAIPSASSTPAATTPPSLAAPASPTPTTPAWQTKYPPEELAAYEEALQRWESYEQRSEGIWAAGKATPAAERLFQEYNGTSSEYNRLVSYEAGDVQIIGLGTVLDSRAGDIKLAGSGGTISIRQCVEYSNYKVVQAGKTLPPVTDKPQLRQINLYLAGEPNQWFISNIVVGEGKSPCSAA